MRALFAGRGTRRALVDGRTGTVEIVSERAAYVRLERDWLLLAEPWVQFGPLSLSVYGLGELGLAPGLPARVAGGRLELGGAGVSLERVRLRCVTSLPRVHADELAVAAAAAAAGSELPGPPASLAGGIAALARGHVSAGCAQLAGRGPGLTPAGDDVLAGYAATRFVVDRRAVVSRLSRRAEGRSSALGLAYLRCAERGELPEPGQRLLGAICAGSVEDVPLACARLRSWGASSGAAIGWGITAAVAQGLPRSVGKVQVR